MGAMAPDLPRSLTSLVLVITGTLALLFPSVAVEAFLVKNYYARSCPRAESVVASIVRARVSSDRSLAASLLRLQFHDCFVLGCEASVLLDSSNGNSAEKDARVNAGSLRGFDVIDQIKSAVESSCPGVVSCSDILALAARDATAFIGGPSWRVPTGRRDGTLSSATQADASMPNAGQNFASLKNLFAANGLTTNDLVVLSAAHTIGRAHCAAISQGLYNFPGTSDGINPALNKAYALKLRKLCPPGSTGFVPMDPSGGGQTFDTNYYSNLFSKKALFPSDQTLLTSSRARGIVQAEISNPSKFFSDFGLAMQKMGRIGVLTKTSPFIGEIRLNCRSVNPTVLSQGGKPTRRHNKASKNSRRTGKNVAKRAGGTKKRSSKHHKKSPKPKRKSPKHKSKSPHHKK